MHGKHSLLISLCILLFLGVSISACRQARTVNTPAQTITTTPTPGESASPTTTASLFPYLPASTPVFVTITPPVYPGPGSQPTASATGISYPQPPAQQFTPTAKQSLPSPTESALQATQDVPTPSVTAPPASPSPTVGISDTPIPQYPGPGVFPSITPKYPGPVITNTPLPYPGPAPTARPTKTPVGTKTTSPTTPATISPTFTPTPTFIPGTPGVIPTELPPKLPISPPPPGSSVTIWHSWNSVETATLQSIIQAFELIYPDVTFSLQYIPLNDLYATYQAAAYNGIGPSLLLGPAKWGPSLFDEQLVSDLTSYVPPDFLSTINPVALSSGKYQEYLISLPLSQQGMVMFRNKLIIKSAPPTFDDLTSTAQTVTHGGLVGSYLERGAEFSSADIIGLGGQLMNADGYPEINNQYGLEWFQLLTDYDVAGAVTFNTNWDLEMFKRGRVGIIIDGTWNINYFSQVLGVENIAIDPWPTYGTGNLSGWVEANSVFFNPNTSGGDRLAALSFMGYLLDPNVQTRLAEVGHIPSVSNALPRDPLIKQAMIAFSSGAAYPINISDDVIQIYQDELNNAIYSVFVKGVSPSEALKLASENIVTQLENIPVEP